MTKTPPKRLLTLFCSEAKNTFKQRVIAIFKIGSLGSHGDFSACSDVDVALILDDIQPTDADKIAKIAETIRQYDLPYADRLSIFWSSYQDFELGKGRFPALDRLEFIKHGLLIQGKDLRQTLEKPTSVNINQESTQFIKEYLLTADKLNELVAQPNHIAEKGARYFSKFILFPVRLLYSISNPNTIGSNKDATHYFLQQTDINDDLKKLVKFSYDTRNNNPYAAINTNNITNYPKTIKALYHLCLTAYLNKADIKDKTLLTNIEKYIELIKNSN